MAATLVGPAGDSAHRIERGRTPGGFAAHRPAKITADQRCQIIALACEKPEQSERPISQWTSREIERREFEYTRHGTLSFIVNFDVATGQVGQVFYGPTRNEADFVAHIRQTIEAEPTVTKWHFVVDKGLRRCQDRRLAVGAWSPSVAALAPRQSTSPTLDSIQRILGRLRHGIETAFSVLTTAFTLRFPHSCSLTGCLARLASKALAYTLSLFLAHRAAA
ncbi:MAG: hypothetical protein ACUVR4_15185 [Anaerolineae bacterium]